MSLKFRKISGPEELEDVFRLRYKVYCEEWGFEKPEDHPGAVERDEFDQHSIHFVAANEHIIGTVRIILNSDKGFPLMQHSRVDADLSSLDWAKVGEISRLAISKDYRRRTEDRFIYEGNGMEPPPITVENERRRQHAIVVGLYKSLYIESKKIGLTHWIGVMAKGLCLLLRRTGIAFVPIGPEVDYHGPRTPYLATIEEIEKEVARLNPALYKEAMEELRAAGLPEV